MDEAPVGTEKLPDARSGTNAVFLGDVHHDRIADTDANTDTNTNTNTNANSDANTNLGFLDEREAPCGTAGKPAAPQGVVDFDLYSANIGVDR